MGVFWTRGHRKRGWLHQFGAARNAAAVTNAAAQIYARLLILRCQAGDEGGLEGLIARYWPGLRLFLRKVGGGYRAAGVDDLLQEVWVEVYRKVNGLRRAEAFGAWV